MMFPQHNLIKVKNRKAEEVIPLWGSHPPLGSGGSREGKGLLPPGLGNLRVLGEEGSGLVPEIDLESPFVLSGLAPPRGRWWGRCQ